jgi:hypothetical protein
MTPTKQDLVTTAGGRPLTMLPAPLVALPAALFMLLVVATAWLAFAGAFHQARGADPAHLSQTALEGESGVRVVRVAVTGAGGLVQLSYQVVDPGKAAAVHDPKARPALVDQETGRVVNRLFMGHMPHGPVNAGVTYYMVFENYDHAIQRGRPVTVELGGGRLEDVAVR